MNIDHGKRTADGVPITDGLIVWDNNLDVCVVDYATTFYYGVISDHWDGWFDTKRRDGGRAHPLNGERMAVTHPFTGERASATSVGYTEKKEMEMNNAKKSDELARLARLADQYEKDNNVPQRSFLYSTSASGTERDRKYIFPDVQLRDLDAALERMRGIVAGYGITDTEEN